MCKYCPKAFASQGNLQSHERTHTGLRPYVCETCGRRFAQRTQLTVHEASHISAIAGQAPLSMVEPACAPKLESIDGQEPDQRTASTPRQPIDYPCLVCGKRFAYASSLCVHMRLHTVSFISLIQTFQQNLFQGERPYACRFCSKRFTNQGNMRVHERVHTGERPFKCPACEKRYAQKVGLRVHLDQCQQYLAAKTVKEQTNGEIKAVKAQKKQRLENLLPKLYSKSFQFR